MAHYDFVQSLFAKSREQPPPENLEPDKETDESVRAFDQAMFADIVPTIDETFTNSSNSSNSAGIFNNSNIVSSPELVSTLDYLNVNVAKIKQQNNALKSMESFFVNYAAQVDEINSSYLRMKMKEHDEKLSHELASDLEKSSKLAKEQVLRLSEQSDMIAIYRKKISDLEQTNEFLLRKVEAYEKFNVNDISDNEFSFTNESSLSNSMEEIGQPLKSDSSPTNSPTSVLPPPSPEILNSPSNNEKASEEDSKKSPSKEPTPTSTPTSQDTQPLFKQLQNTLLQYRNHGAMLECRECSNA